MIIIIYPLLFLFHLSCCCSSTTTTTTTTTAEAGLLRGTTTSSTSSTVGTTTTTTTTTTGTTTRRNHNNNSNKNLHQQQQQQQLQQNLLLSQTLIAPYYGQHVGLSYVDLNGDGKLDLLFASGRHWIDQCYALINLGPKIYNNPNSGNKRFNGIQFSNPLKIGPPGGYYQIDVLSTTTSESESSSSSSLSSSSSNQSHISNSDDDDNDESTTVTTTTTITTKVLLVGGLCRHTESNSFGSCYNGQITPARVLKVIMKNNNNNNNNNNCNINNNPHQCKLEWYEEWVHPNPLGDRNGGFVVHHHHNNKNLLVVDDDGRQRQHYNNNNNSKNNSNPCNNDNQGLVSSSSTSTSTSSNFALLGNGGVEIFASTTSTTTTRTDDDDVANNNNNNNNRTLYERIFHLETPPKINPNSSGTPRYSGFATGYLPKFGPVIVAGRRTNFDPPQIMDDGKNIIGINDIIYNNKQQLLQTQCRDDKDNYDYDSNSTTTITNSTTIVSSHLPGNVTGEPYPGNTSYSIQSTNYEFADINGDGIDDLLEATYINLEKIKVHGYPLPQRIHFFNSYGHINHTLIVLESKENDAGRSVTTGQIFNDSTLPDVVFASVKGVVTIFANLGINKSTGVWNGLQQRYEFIVTAPSPSPSVEEETEEVEEGITTTTATTTNSATTTKKDQDQQDDHDHDHHLQQENSCSVRDIAVVPLLLAPADEQQQQQHDGTTMFSGGSSTATAAEASGIGDYLHEKKNEKKKHQTCWIGIVCAVVCEELGDGNNRIFYVEGDASACPSAAA